MKIDHGHDEPSLTSMIAPVNGCLGILAAFWVGRVWLGSLSTQDVALCILASWIAGFTALMTVLRGAKHAWGRWVLFNTAATWIVFLGIYFGGTLWLAPPLQSAPVFWRMILPLMFANGWVIVAFGPIQDYLVAREQLMLRSRS